MTQDQILVVLKELVIELNTKSNPAHLKEFAKLKTLIDEKITPDTPLAALGWDSLQMTFLLVSIEERLDIDTSGLSLFDLFTIGDFLSELEALTKKKKK
ncbi:MAG: acyl carrier protein [Xanthomonadaceae bacterium]|nr:acyl carrier protein [Xanthomonadaceae bacterium]